MSEPTLPLDEHRTDRRSFLKIAGIGGAVLVASGCDSDAPDPIDPGNFDGLMGTVTTVTEDGATVPLDRVIISLMSEDRDVDRTAETGDDGTYVIPNLPVGTYTVVATSPNFIEDETEEVVISVGGNATANFTLEPGGDIEFDFADDFGPLNYAYALEQLEAAFYAAVLAAPYDGIPDDERRIIEDLAAHEAVHRDFLEAALRQAGGTFTNRNLIPPLTPDFSAVKFEDRRSVLTTAQIFEDLGVAAYNGAARSFSDTEAGKGYLLLAGKIVSVEARHASSIANLLVSNAIAANGVIGSDGLDQALPPNTVLAKVAPYLENGAIAVNV